MDLQKFDLETLRNKTLDYFTIAIYGPSRSGKSHNVQRLVLYMQMKNLITPENTILFKNSTCESKYIDKLFPNQLKWDEQKLTDYLEHRGKIMTLAKQHNMTDKVPPVLIICDDISEKRNQIRECNAFKELILSGRHLKLYRIISYHDFTFINKALRDSVDFLMFTKIDNKSIIDWIRRYELHESVGELIKTIVNDYTTDEDGKKFITIVFYKRSNDFKKRWTYIK